MSKFFQKIITLTYLTVFLFILFTPFNVSLAQTATNPLVISSDKTSMKTGESAKITATVFSGLDFGGPNGTGSATITFQSLGGNFSPTTCIVTKGSGPIVSDCFVNFSSVVQGSFSISAHTDVNGIPYGSNTTPITVSNVTVIVPLNTPPTETETTYNPLVDLGTGPIETTGDCPFGGYLNTMIKIILGIAAVLAMVMITMGGVEYMTSELVSGKEAGKEAITHAILGLLIALGAYLILNTINPQVLNSCLNLPAVTIDDFEVSGGSIGSFDGQPIKVNFNREAYPAAKVASQKTGVDIALILAIFSQETGGGRNTGRCKYSDAAANMYPEDITALRTITSELGKSIESTPVSCALLNPDGSFNGHGGAIGLTQFRPATWLENRAEATSYLGHRPDPWNAADALMMTAVYLKRLGGVSNQKESACKYFGGPGVSCSTNSGINAYGNSVMGKKLSIEKQIAEAIRKGEIQP